MRLCKNIGRRIPAAWLLAPLLALFSFAALPGCSPLDRNFARNGLADFRSINELSGAEVVGEWEIYWNRLYTPLDFQNPALQAQLERERRYFRVPGRWDLPGEPQQRHATMRLRWHGELPANALFSIRWAGSAMRLLCGADVDERGGLPGTNAAQEIPAYRAIEAAPAADCRARRELVLQISNYNYAFGGPVYPLLVGSMRALMQHRHVNLLLDISLLGLALGIGIYHLAFWFFRRQRRWSLFFALLCFAFLTRVNDTAALLPALYPNTDIFPLHAKVSFIGIYALTALFVEFLRQLFPDELHRYVSIAVGVIAAAFSVHALFAPLLPLSMAVEYFLPVLIAALSYCALGVALAVIRRRPSATLMSIGILLLCGASINDVLVQQLLYRGPRLANPAFFLFLVTQSAILAGRFSKSLERTEHLTENLEREVAAQTEQLRIANLRLEEADRLRTSFIQNVSHELRTPLTLIHGPLESAEARNEPVDASTVPLILANSRRLLRLVNRLLDMQKISAGRLQLEKQPLALRPFLEASLSAFQPYARSRGIVLHTEIEAELPVTHADPDKIDKCLYNYLSNALKFTPEGGRVLVEAKRDGEGIRVAVSDTGAGLSRERQLELFQRFGRSETGLLGQEGSGLGLALVKELIEMHGGRVGVESEPGRGSRFWFWLPADSEADPVRRRFDEGQLRASIELSDVSDPLRESADASGAVSGSFDLGRHGKILLVEDHPDLQRYVARVLARDGHSTLVAGDAEEALRLLSGEAVDLVITDYMLGTSNGLDLARELRRQEATRTTPILMLTAWGEETLRRSAANEGIDAFLGKPFQTGELLAMVRNLLALKSTERAYRFETEHARRIQQSILPARLPVVPGLRMAASYFPYQAIGGDFYDVIPFADGSVGAFVADVSGHGVSAALVATMGKIALGWAAAGDPDPAGALARANAYLHERAAGNFLTCSFVRVAADRRSLQAASAGHLPAIQVRGGVARTIPVRGRALALLPESEYKSVFADLQSGDRILLYTDAITEAQSAQGEFFGERSLLRFCAGAAALGPEEFLDRMHRELLAFRQQSALQDDFTALVLDAE